MPNYDYKCKECQTVFELHVPMENRDLVFECKTCGGISRRVITFKGSVWSPTRNGGHS